MNDNYIDDDPTKGWDPATYGGEYMDSIDDNPKEGFHFSSSPFSSPNVMEGGDVGDFQEFSVSPQTAVPSPQTAVPSPQTAVQPQTAQGTAPKCSTGGLPMFGGEGDPMEGLFDDPNDGCSTVDIPSHLLRPSHEEVKSYQDRITQLNEENTKVSQQFGMMKRAFKEIRVHAKATNDENKRLRKQNHHLCTLVDSQASKVLDFGPSITEGFADYITFLQNDKPRFTCSKRGCKRFRNIQISCGHGICDTCFEDIDSSKSSKCPFCGMKGTFFGILDR